MATTTPILGLTQLAVGDLLSAYPTEQAANMATLDAAMLFTPVQANANYTAKGGDFVQCSAAGISITLPTISSSTAAQTMRPVWIVPVSTGAFVAQNISVVDANSANLTPIIGAAIYYPVWFATGSVGAWRMAFGAQQLSLTNVTPGANLTTVSMLLAETLSFPSPFSLQTSAGGSQYTLRGAVSASTNIAVGATILTGLPTTGATWSLPAVSVSSAGTPALVALNKPAAATTMITGTAIASGTSITMPTSPLAS